MGFGLSLSIFILYFMPLSTIWVPKKEENTQIQKTVKVCLMFLFGFLKFAFGLYKEMKISY